VERGDNNLIAWLGQARGGATELGGKGASLDRLAKLGFRVPPGFCLTTAAFRAQVATGIGLDDLAAAPLAAGVADPLAGAIGRLVAEVVHAHPTAPRFAVRSSAVGEDGSAASYAGLHETELDVPPDGIADSVRRCWASLWSPPAIAYRRRRDLPDEGAEMAVVVQSLVPADASAVAFTRHPVTGRDDQLVLTAVRGLGDAMVAGTVTPDTYVIAKADGAVVDFEPGEGPGTPALAATILADLVRLCLDVEAKFGQAVDIEAAMAGGTWYLLQARPITTGAPAPAAR
jgi:phosphoenolpyruvate synthase/pyruvate phosphate dikinase